MPFTGPNYVRMKSDKNIALWIARTGGATGVVNIGAPTAAELVPGGARGTLNASPSTSWNDTDFGIQASDTTSDPSLADDSTYEDFGQMNYGGNISTYYPKKYDDNSNNHSLVYDMTDKPWTKLDVVMRIDGGKPNSSVAANGDFVHGARVITDAEQNSLAGADALRRTINCLPNGEVAPYTIVGPHAITANPSATTPWKTGKKARLRATVGGRDYTNALSYTSSDSNVVAVYPGGFYEVKGAAASTATITITDAQGGTTQTVSVTVTA